MFSSKFLGNFYKLTRCKFCCYFSTGNILWEKAVCEPTGPALILGVYTHNSDERNEHLILTPTAARFNEKTNGNLMKQLTLAFPPPLLGDYRILYGVDPSFSKIVCVGVGDPCLGFNPQEQLDERKEAIRAAAGVGIKVLQAQRTQSILIESFEHAESAAEGAFMAAWLYQELKSRAKQMRIPKIDLFDCCDWAGWQIGLEKARAQNIARHLMETPANILTPTKFSQSTVDLLSKNGVNIDIRVKHWAEVRNMNAFIAVAKGSCEPPIFMELLYEGCDPNIHPIVLIGKGVTFDSGGLCLKSCTQMKHQRGDMSGAACVVATFNAVGTLRLPVNLRGLIPLCVNSPGATAFKPGDVVRAMNGKTIVVEDTDNSEGILMHADALSYAKEFCPKLIIDVGTMAPGMESGMGSSASGVFSNNESLYETIRIASIHTGDRIWPFPLWNYFKEYITNSSGYDLINLAEASAGGGPGRAAAFLQEFVPKGTDWVHIDSYNVTRTSGKVYHYLRRGMAGRPTRTIIEFLAQLCCKNTKVEKKCTV